jgi:hypothetical protein
MIGGQTKFALARAAAQTQVEAVLDMVKAAVTAAQWNSFLGIPAEPDPQLSDYEWDCAEFCPNAGCNFGCFDASLGGDDLQLNLPSGALGSPDSVSLVGIPGSFFLTSDMLVAGDGAQIIPGWEVKVGEFELNGAFQQVATATAAVPDSDTSAFPGDAWDLYFMDQSAEAWVRVGNATVDLGSKQATFPVASAGIYALGHRPAITATLACVVEAEAAPAGVDVRWFAPSGARGPYRVLRSLAADAAYRIVHEEPAADPQTQFIFRDQDVAPATRYYYEVAYPSGAAWIASAPASAATPALRLGLHAPAPNPSSGGARIDFELPRLGRVALDILDAQGRVVRRIVHGPIAAGAHSVAWDGRAESGARMASGIYFARLEFEGRTMSRILAVTGR